MFASAVASVKIRAVGRQIFKAVLFEELAPLIERILMVYMNKRNVGESFQAFTARHEVDTLQALFSS